MTLSNIDFLKRVFHNGIPLQEAVNRFIYSILSVLIVSVFAIGAVLYVCIGRLNELERTGREMRAFQANVVRMQGETAQRFIELDTVNEDVHRSLLLLQESTARKFLELEAFNKETILRREWADSSDAVYQEMYLRQYREYELMLDAEKQKQGQQRDTTDGTIRAR